MVQDHWYVAFMTVFQMVRSAPSPPSSMVGKRLRPRVTTGNMGQTPSSATTLWVGCRRAMGAATYPRMPRMAIQSRTHHWVPHLTAEAETLVLRMLDMKSVPTTMHISYYDGKPQGTAYKVASDYELQALRRWPCGYRACHNHKDLSLDPHCIC